jgi:outer membrane protein assembly factor BamB
MHSKPALWTLIAFLIVALQTTVTNAQLASFKWARLLTGFTNEDQLRTAAMDGDGNIIASYYRQDAQQPGPWRSNLVMKIDTKAGEVLWSHRRLPSARGLAVARDGAVLVAGGLAYLNDNLGASLGGSQTYFSGRGIPTEGTGGGYLARLAPATGAVESVRHFGTSLYVMPYYLAAAPEGDFVVFGLYMRAAAQFGDITLPAPSTSTTRNLFLVKLGPAGEIRWAKAFPSAQNFVYMNGMAVDGMGNVIVGGYVGKFTLDGTEVADQVFTAKFTPDGTLLWVKNGMSGTPLLDKHGNIFVTGYADGASLLQKYDSNGELLRSIPAPSFSKGVVDAGGNFIGAGSFRIKMDDSDFNSIHPGEVTVGDVKLQSEAEMEMFAAKQSASGEFNWAVQTQGQDFAYRPWPDGTFGGAGYIASWTTPNFVFTHPERGILVGGIVMGRTLFGETLLEGQYKKDLQPETSFFLARINEPAPVPVALKVARTSAGLVLSWPSSFSGFLLETASAFPAANWSAVPGVPSVVGDQNIVTVEAGGGAKFYRLRKP